MVGQAAVSKRKSYSYAYGLRCSKGYDGVRVLDVVPGSVAHLMGMRKGWFIVAINDKPARLGKLKQAISQLLRDQDVQLRLTLKNRKGRLKRIVLPLSEPFSTRYAREKQEKIWDLAGFMIGFCVDGNYSVLFVARVRPGSRAEKLGLRLFDRILAINDVVPYTPERFFQLIFEAEIIGIRIKNNFGDMYVLRAERTMLLPDEEQMFLNDAAMEGENIVSEVLSRLNGDYYELRGIILPFSRNQGTEIDHVLVGPEGVFVVETKRLTGCVVGKDEEKYWVQYVGRTRKEIFNPVWQNRYHERAVKGVLGSYGIEVPVLPVVVVVGGTVRVNSDMPVIADKDLLDFVRKHPRMVNEQECRRIAKILESERLSSFYGW